MKKLLIPKNGFVACLLATVVIALSSDAARADAFTAGNLVVVRVGAGVSSANNATNYPVFLQEYTPAGGSIQTIALPAEASGGNSPLTLQGSASSEGFLKLSTDGQYLTLGGYAVTQGVFQVATSNALEYPRVVGRIDASGGINTTTVMTNYSGSNIRGAASTDGIQIWTSGNGGSGQGATAGVRFMTLGSPTSIRLNDTASNMRVVNIFNGQLYVSSASGTNLGVNTVGTGLPTTGDQTNPLSLLSGFPTNGTHSSYDFWFKDANTLYVADDGGAASGGGIQKWTLSGGTWTLQYTLFNNGSATTAVRCLTGTTNGSGEAVLYATTTQTSANNLITVTDTGASATATTVATAPALTVFRGVAFAPVAAVAPVTKPVILSTVISGNNVTLTWSTSGGTTNFVQARTSLSAGSFSDISPAIYIPGSGPSVTNYTEINGANNPTRYYQIRSVKQD
jgi:hypothetical protein